MIMRATPQIGAAIVTPLPATGMLAPAALVMTSSRPGPPSPC
ncbi:hypothetical protein ABGB14_45145 [Nonomuraea sp. B10E15]